MPAQRILRASERLADAVDALRFAEPVAFTYNPLRYAMAPFRHYVERYSGPPKEAVFVGMNPGPFGMAQTGIPFGQIAAVRDWMRIQGVVDEPPSVHPKRPVEGFACTRSEVSGARLWGWAASRFGSAEAFFERFFVLNYCPLAFMEASGRNRTPDKLPAAERDALFACCDQALVTMLDALQPRWVIGVGAFARARVDALLPRLQTPAQPGTVLHPSPASPHANRGWAEAAERQLRALGLSF